ncbi:hypothetical protein VTG60DRAFT_2028 [Thermothelomyces hinnuleus]
MVCSACLFFPLSRNKHQTLLGILPPLTATARRRIFLSRYVGWRFCREVSVGTRKGCGSGQRSPRWNTLRPFSVLCNALPATGKSVFVNISGIISHTRESPACSRGLHLKPHRPVLRKLQPIRSTVQRGDCRTKCTAVFGRRGETSASYNNMRRGPCYIWTLA